MNQTSKYDNLKYWLEEDLSNIVSSQDHWSQGDDNIFSRSSQYYADNADRLPEPELPETLKYTREYLLVPAKPCKCWTGSFMNSFLGFLVGNLKAMFGRVPCV